MNNEIKIQPSKGNNKVEVSNNFAQYFEQLAKKHADDAKESELLAKDWANKLGSTVDDTEYSAKHYALKSKEEHDGAVTDIATAKTELEQSIATGLEDYNTNAQAKSDSLQKQFDTSISDIKKQETTSINAVKTTQTTAESSITELKTSAELTITNGMADITSNKEQSMSAIDGNRETSLAEIESAKSGAVSSINTTKDNAVSTVKQTGTDEYNKILSTGIDSKLGENLITNCLKEIPQRIKLELNDGVLTLKAGSQVTIPNGFEADGTTPKLDYVEIENDLTYTINNNQQSFLLIDNNKNITARAKTWSFSGKQPSGLQYMAWYDNATNLMKFSQDNGSTWISGYSLPLALFTANATQIIFLDQVFNGMGYIGSTIWLDKGVKGLVSIGRNEADGSLINEEVTTDKLYMLTYPWGTTSRIFGYELSDGTDVIPENHLIADIPSLMYEQPVMPTGTNWKWINTANNQIWYKNENATSAILHKPYKIKNMFLGKFTTVEGRITSFTPKLPFRAADENDIDGKWMRQSLRIINGETAFPLGSTQYRDYDISNYLPNDGHIYELAVEILAFSGSSTNATSHWWVSDAVTSGQACSCGGRAYSNARDQQYANGIILMANRTLRLYCSSSGTAPTISVLRVFAYRKVR